MPDQRLVMKSATGCQAALIRAKGENDTKAVKPSITQPIIGIWWPTHVFQAAENLNKLLGAVPESLWWLFGAGYLGYTGARSFDKWRGPAR